MKLLLLTPVHQNKEKESYEQCGSGSTLGSNNPSWGLLSPEKHHPISSYLHSDESSFPATRI